VEDTFFKMYERGGIKPSEPWPESDSDTPLG
jgi:hypothetical protein